MAIVPVRGNSKPSHNSVHILDNDAVAVQRELLKKWKPQREVWWLQHGEKIIAGMCAVNGLVINSLFRHKLKLHNNGRVLSLAYAIIGPGVLGGFFFGSWVTNDILLYKHGCPVCYEVKASLITAATATLFPLLTMPVLSLGLAASVGLRVPYLYEVRELANFGWNVIKPGVAHVSFLFAANSVASSYIAYKQMAAADTIANTLLNLEKYLQEKESKTLE